MSTNLDNVFWSLPPKTTAKKRSADGELCGESFGIYQIVNAGEVCEKCHSWCNIGAHMCGACGLHYCPECMVARNDFKKLADVFHRKYEWTKHVHWQSLCVDCAIPFEIAFDD